jgi:secreted trypsin-like serine protease
MCDFNSPRKLLNFLVKITGGTVARAREFPYTVSIRTKDLDNLGHFCGGAILSPTLILTAGACTDPQSPNITEIVAGTLFRTEPYPGQQSRGVSKFVPHPGYIFPPYDDLSLIFLDAPLEFNENISAIALPEAGQQTYPCK